MTFITNLNPATIANAVKGMSAQQLLDVWQLCLDEQMATPPNDRHFECSGMIMVLDPIYRAQVEVERVAAVVAADKAAKEAVAAAKAKVKQNGPNVAKIVYDMRIALWGVVRAVGPEAALTHCKKAIADCLKEDSHQ